MRFHNFLSLSDTNTNTETCRCAVSSSCTALFLVNTCFFFHCIDIQLPSVLQCCSTGTCLPLGLASAASLLSSPSSLPRPFLGIHQFSCSFPRGPTGHSYTYTQSCSQQHHPSVDLSTHLRLSLLQMGAVAIWRSCQMSRWHTKSGILNEKGRKLLFAPWKLAKSYGVTQCVIVHKNKLVHSLTDWR